MNVLLIGATGYAGSAILNELVSRGHSVTAVVRDVSKLQDSQFVKAVAGDATDPEALARLARGKDAVISAYNPGWKNPRLYEDTLENYPKIVEGVRSSGVKRLLIVGGAGTAAVVVDHLSEQQRNHLTLQTEVPDDAVVNLLYV